MQSKNKSRKINIECLDFFSMVRMKIDVLWKQNLNNSIADGIYFLRTPLKSGIDPFSVFSEKLKGVP